MRNWKTTLVGRWSAPAGCEAEPTIANMPETLTILEDNPAFEVSVFPEQSWCAFDVEPGETLDRTLVARHQGSRRR